MSAQKATNDLVPPLDATPAFHAQSRRQVGWGFWLKWVLATATGWAIGIIVYSIFQLAIATVGSSIESVQYASILADYCSLRTLPLDERPQF